MKKTILITSLAIIALGLTAFGVISQNNLEAKTVTQLETKEDLQTINTNFVHDVGPRFSPIKKNDLYSATSIRDFLSQESFNSILNLKSVNVVIIKNEGQTNIQELGYTKTLTPGQLKLFKSLDYDSQFNIRAEFTEVNKQTGLLQHNYDSPHLSVVPEKQAIYANGSKVLIDFLRQESKAYLAKENADVKEIKPTKMHFIVTIDGSIKNVRLDKKSIYPNIDKKMIELIESTAGDWIPAENSKGEKVEQSLCVTFGFSMDC